MLDQDFAEDIRPRVVVRDPYLLFRCFGQTCAIAFAIGDGGEQIDANKAFERRRHRQQLRLGEGIGDFPAKRELADPGRLRGMGYDHHAIGHHGVVGRVGAVPFQHGEFGQMQRTALAVAKHPRELKNLRLASGQQFLAGEFRRGAQIARRAGAVGAGKFGARRMQMGLIARRDLQNGCLDLDKPLLVKPGADRLADSVSRQQKRPAVGVPGGRPPGRKRRVLGCQRTTP